MFRSTLSMFLAIGAAFLWFAPPGRADEPAGDSPTSRPTTEPAAGAAKADAANRPQIEVCFVLDTTGSMGGLIEGAKQKIWSIANTIIAMKDKPQIRIALVPYRDKGDAYVTKVFDLTDDIDAVFKNLMSFKAEGGGDEPESVNQALNEAITKVAWTGKKEVSKIVFLVGDAPPHMDYKDDVKYADTCKLAAERDITINAVQCGAVTATGPIWQEIAHLGHGMYIPLAQEGGMVAIATPVDKELAELNSKVAGTVVYWGQAGQQHDVMEKVAMNGAAGPVGAFGTGGRAVFGAPGPSTRPAAPAEYARLADRAVYNGRDGGKAIQGRGDLIWDCANGVVDLAKLTNDELPPELQKMTPDERKAYVAAKQKERDALQNRVAELTKKREEFVAAERSRLAKQRKSDAFDDKVAAAVREQSEAKK